jgi:hypothetical protein
MAATVDNYLLKQGMGPGILGSLKYDDEKDSWALNLGFNIMVALFATVYPFLFDIYKCLNETESILEEHCIPVPRTGGHGGLEILRKELESILHKPRSSSAEMIITKTDRALIYIGALSGALAQKNVFIACGTATDAFFFSDSNNRYST